MTWRIPKGLQQELQMLQEETPGFDLSDAEGGRDRPRLADLRQFVEQAVEAVTDAPLRPCIDSMQRRVKDAMARIRREGSQFPGSPVLDQSLQSYQKVLDGLARMTSWFDIEPRPEYLTSGLSTVETGVQELENLMVSLA